MKRIFLIFAFIFIYADTIYAQGGPPMITDDPGTPDKGSWEINISFNTDLKTGENDLEIPLLDINYGFNERTQLKIEFANLLTKTGDDIFKDSFGDISLGAKYRFLDESRSMVSFSIYPQLVLAAEKNGLNEYLFPLQLEKTFGSIALGVDFGYAYLKDSMDYFHNGILIGYEFSDKLQLMSELNFQVDGKTFKELDGTINFGLHYELNEKCTFLGSAGTGIISADTDSRLKFISFIGLQFT